MYELQKDFINQLISKYGEWQKNSARFGSFSYGEIADDLSISGSQFSKLLYGTATNGMYERAIKNIKRLKEKQELFQANQQMMSEIEDLNLKVSNLSAHQGVHFKYVVLAIIAFLALGYLIRGLVSTEPVKELAEHTTEHVLNNYFDQDLETIHISPYLSSGEAQDYCPCSAFEGTWGLTEQYTIPVPTGKPGLYYLAKATDMKIKCQRSGDPDKKGKEFLGFEEMTHELWLDVNREPISPKYFNFENKSYTKDFFEIDFENNDQFVRVAEIKSLMFDKFELDEKFVHRSAEPLGRYVNFLDEDLCNEYQIDVEMVMEDIIGNLVRTVCEPSINEFCNPNELKENESHIDFRCKFTINYENLGIGGSYPYTKSITLLEQNYSDNMLCTCQDDF